MAQQRLPLRSSSTTRLERQPRTLRRCASPLSLAAACTILLALCSVAATAGAAAAGRDGGRLPACDKAAELYKQGKLYDVLGLKKSADKKAIRRCAREVAAGLFSLPV